MVCIVVRLRGSVRGRVRRSSRLGGVDVSVVEDFLDGGVLGDESDNLHHAAALVTGQGVDFEDAIDELGPTFVCGASSCRPLGLVIGRNVASVGLSNTIGVGAIESESRVSFSSTHGFF